MTPEIQPYAAISKDPMGLPNESNGIAGLGIFASILDHVGVLVVVFDTAGRIVYWNRASAQVAGRRLDEAMRVPFWDWLLPEEERGYAQQAWDRKSTRLNSSHLGISYAVFCLKKK